MSNKSNTSLQKEFVDAMRLKSYPSPTYNIAIIRECFDQILEEYKEVVQVMMEIEDFEEELDKDKFTVPFIGGEEREILVGGDGTKSPVIPIKHLDDSSDVRAKVEKLLANLCAELSDLQYVCMQLCNRLGLPNDLMFTKIHEANMNKRVDGKIIKSANGKVLKPEGWKPVDKVGVLRSSCLN